MRTTRSPTATVRVDVPVTQHRARDAAPRSCSATCTTSTASVARPPQELKAFAKVWLDPGEPTTVTLRARPARRSRSGTSSRARWTVEPGEFELRIGTSSRDIRAPRHDHDRLSDADDRARRSPSGCRTSASFYPPDEWHRFVDLARAAEDAGVDRIVVVDHVVMGPHTENVRVGQVPGSARSAVVRAADGARGDRGGRPTRVRLATGILIAPLRPGRAAREAGRDARRAVAGPARSRRRHRLAARGVRRGRARLRRGAVSCSPTRSRRARRCGATRRPRSTRRRCRSATSTATRSRVQPGGVPLWIGGALHTRNLDRLVRYGDAWIPIMGETARRHRRRRAADRATRGRTPGRDPDRAAGAGAAAHRTRRRRPARPRPQHGVACPSWSRPAPPTCT